MAGFRFALSIAGVALGGIGPASAAVLPIIGAYGNAAGCQAYYTGTIEGDDYLLLTADTFSSYGSGCDFAELMSSAEETLVVSGICFDEGEEGSRIDSVIITGTADGGIYVELEGLEPLGPIHLCPPKSAGTFI